MKIGVIGLGTVGFGVVEILTNEKQRLEQEIKEEVVIKYGCGLEEVDLPEGIIYTNDFHDVINDKEIDVVVELIGGINVAKEIILGAINNGKHVVTANKALLAHHGKEIFTAARENNVHIFYEASVGGGIPVLVGQKESLIANNTKEIIGILNGTTNSNVTTSTSANIAAGSVEEFDVIITPPSFPPIYNAVSEDPDLLEVVSTGRTLVLSAENAAEITETKVVRVKITSDYFYSSEGVTLTFTIIPSNLSLAGTWTTDNADYPNSSIVFTDNPYSGSTSLSEPKTGTITDVYNGRTWEFDFYYQFEAGKIKAQVYDQRVSTNKDEDLYPMDTLNLVMEYNASTDTLNVYLSYYEMAEGSFEAIEWGIIGTAYEEGYYIGVDFTRN